MEMISNTIVRRTKTSLIENQLQPDKQQRRGIMPSSSRLIKPGRAGSIAPSEVGQDSLQDESSLDGEENSSEK